MNSVFDPPTNDTQARSASDSTTSESTSPSPAPIKVRRPRGFAAMDRSKVSEIASKGGKAAHAAGTAHQFSSDEARNAGHKGGVAPHVRRGRGPRNPHIATTTSNAPSQAKDNAAE